MTIQTESPASLLPRLLLPYGRQWAERSGHQVLARLLADEQLVELVERYGGELIASFTPQPKDVCGEVVDPEPKPPDDSAELLARIAMLERQQEQVSAIFDIFREKAQPLARALGCCPDCFIGLPLCPTCLGHSTVGGRKADMELLRTLIVAPLSASGIGIDLCSPGRSPASPRANPVDQVERRSA